MIRFVLQVRVTNVLSKSGAAGLSQWAAVSCDVVAVLLSAERVQALRPGVAPGCGLLVVLLR